MQIAKAASDAAFAAKVASGTEPSYAIHVIGDPTRVKEETGHLWADALKFLCLPMLLVSARRDEVERLTRSSDLLVTEVAPEQGREISALVPLLRGLDLMCAVETASAAGAEAPYLFGGTRRGIGGYPTLIEDRRGPGLSAQRNVASTHGERVCPLSTSVSNRRIGRTASGRRQLSIL